MSVGDTFKCTTNISLLVVNREKVRYNCSNENLEPSLVPRLHFSRLLESRPCTSVINITKLINAKMILYYKVTKLTKLQNKSQP